MKDKITAEDMIESLGLLKPKFSLYIVRCFKIKKQQFKKYIWQKIFNTAKKMDKVYNFITR